MKHGKKPTVRQMEKLKKYKLDPKGWLIVKDCTECFEIVSRITGQKRKLDYNSEVQNV